MRLTTVILSLCLIAQPITGLAEGADVRFSPETLFQTIDERSHTIKLGQLVADEAAEGVEVAKNSLLPDINASWQVGYLGDGYLTDRNFSNGMHVDNPHFVNNLAVEAMQLIYSGGAVTQSIKIATLKEKMARLSADNDKQQVRFVLLSRLIDLECLYKTRQVLVNNIDLARKVLETMHARYEQGVILKNDITRYELQISDLQLQLDKTDEAISVANATIANALDYEKGTTFALDAETIDENTPIADIDTWQVQAANSNLGIKQAEVGKDISEAALLATKADKLPHVSAFAYGQFNSPITIEVPVLNKNFMYWGFGVNVSYNISSLYKTDKKERQARAGVAESEEKITLAEEGVRDEVKTAYEAYRTAQSQLRTRRSSLKLANENYDIVNQRFDEGMAIVTDLVDAANVMISAQTGVENAKSRLNFCLYRLKYVCNDL